MTKILSHILTPETEKKFYQESLLPYFLRGQSAIVMWVRHAGRRRNCRFLAQYADRFGFKNLGQYKLVVVPHADLVEETPQGFFKLMLNCLSPENKFQNSEEAFLVLKQEVEKLTAAGWHLIFILERFDELNDDSNFPSSFFNNLHNLWLIDRARVHYLFAVATDIFRSESFWKLSHLREVASQNLIYFPLAAGEDNETCLKYLEQKYGYRVSPKQKNLIKIICGGHASLNRAAMRILEDYHSCELEKVINYLSLQYEIKVILEDIWNSFDDEEKKVLKLIAQGNALRGSKIPERLLKLRVIAGEKNNFDLFSPLFKNFIASIPGNCPQLMLGPQTNELLINGSPAREKITLQEYLLLSSFLKKKNSVLSREQIAQALWGKLSDEKYSDWAIDQVISQLRRKMEKLGLSSAKLQTIRNRGYRWVD